MSNEVIEDFFKDIVTQDERNFSDFKPLKLKAPLQRYLCLVDNLAEHQIIVNDYELVEHINAKFFQKFNIMDNSGDKLIGSDEFILANLNIEKRSGSPPRVPNKKAKLE